MMERVLPFMALLALAVGCGSMNDLDHLAADGVAEIPSDDLNEAGISDPTGGDPLSIGGPLRIELNINLITAAINKDGLLLSGDTSSVLFENIPDSYSPEDIHVCVYGISGDEDSIAVPMIVETEGFTVLLPADYQRLPFIKLFGALTEQNCYVEPNEVETPVANFPLEK